MGKLIDKTCLRETFSKAASGYDCGAWLQRKLALQLLDSVKADNILPRIILDIGMGTGFLMQEFERLYPKASVLGIDFAFGMNKLAREKNLNVFQADAELLPFKDKAFDLIISSLVYQWISDLDRAFSEVSRTLKEKGDFYFIFFGRDTLKELRFSFSEAKGNRLNKLFNNYFSPADSRSITSALENNNFKDTKINTSIVKVSFEDLFSLVKWLKLIGVSRIVKPIFMGKEIWQEANEIYSDNFKDDGSVYATFEVIEVRAKK